MFDVPASPSHTSPRPRPIRLRVPHLMSSSPSSRVPKSQVPTHASRSPRPLVPVPLLYTTQKYGLFCSLFCHRFGEYSNWVAEGVPWIVDFVKNGESGENTENAKVSQGSFAEDCRTLTWLDWLYLTRETTFVKYNWIKYTRKQQITGSGVNYVLAPCTSQVKVNIFLLFNHFQSRLTYQK